jgi:hypothetical protein
MQDRVMVQVTIGEVLLMVKFKIAIESHPLALVLVTEYVPEVE